MIDGLLYHETDLDIHEHYADTGGYTDQMFSTCHLLGFRFAPRLRDLGDRKLYTIEKPSSYADLNLIIGGTVNVRQITEHWEELLRLTASLCLGTVTASLMLRKLASYPRQNGLAWALREMGRIEKTLFTLEWFQSVELRRRVQVGLNKEEARNALARPSFSIGKEEYKIVHMPSSSNAPRDSTWSWQPSSYGIPWNWHESLRSCRVKAWR